MREDEGQGARGGGGEAAPRTLLVFGLGFTGKAIAARAAGEGGAEVIGTSREPGGAGALPPGVGLVPFRDAGAAISRATHLVVTAPPGEGGDPVLAAWGDAIAAAPRLCWIGYLSTTGVYGDRGGAWVDEAAVPAPGQDRSRRRLAAEEAWRALAARARNGGGAALDLLRLGGIYGPGRSPFDDLRAGTARRVVKPGHAFGRIHVEDAARAVLAAMRRPPSEGGAGGGAPVRVLHLVDDEPAESAVVLEEAARLLGVPPPPELPFERAAAAMSPMARSFWAESRRVANAATKAALGLAWSHPTYREGLRAVLAAEADARPSG